MDERAKQRIDTDRAEKHDDAKERRVAQPGGGHAADEPDEGADRQVEFVAGDDEHLCDGGERDRDRQVQHQAEAEIADGARVEPGDGDQHKRERQRRQHGAQHAGTRGGTGAGCRTFERDGHHLQTASLKEDWITFSSVSSPRSKLATMRPPRNT